MMRKRKDILPTSTKAFMTSRSSKGRGFQSQWNTTWMAIIQYIIIITLCIAVFYYRSELSKSNETTKAVLTKYSEQLDLLKQQQDEMKQLRSAAEQKRTINEVPKDRPASPSHNKDKDEWNENDKKWIKDIQDNDYRSLVLQYGTAPIQVLIETKFGDIILEMAPTQSMPHTIRYFLTLVENDYWNGRHVMFHCEMYFQDFQSFLKDFCIFIIFIFEVKLAVISCIMVHVDLFKSH